MASKLKNNNKFKFLLTIIFGLSGSISFKLLGIPSPWLTGPMLFIAIFGFMKIPFHYENKLNHPVLYGMGVLIGSEFDKDKVSQIVNYPITITIMFVSAIVVYFIQYLFYRKIIKWGVFDSLYSSAPGNLSIVVALASQNKANIQNVTLVQSTRLFLISALIPISLKFVFHIENHNKLASSHLDLFGHSFLFIIPLVCFIPLVYVFKKIRMPLPSLLAPMVGTMILSGTNVIGKIETPLLMTIIVYLLYGINVGMSLYGIHFKKALRLIYISIIAFIIILINDFIFSYATSHFMHIDLTLLMISFIPGGFQAMGLVSIGLGLDSIFCTVHHIIRVNAFAFITPALSARISKLGKKKNINLL